VVYSHSIHRHNYRSACTDNTRPLKNSNKSRIQHCSLVACSQKTNNNLCLQHVEQIKQTATGCRRHAQCIQKHRNLMQARIHTGNHECISRIRHKPLHVQSNAHPGVTNHRIAPPHKLHCILEYRHHTILLCMLLRIQTDRQKHFAS